MTGIRFNDQSFINNIQYSANGVKTWTYSQAGDAYDLDGRISKIQMPRANSQDHQRSGRMGGINEQAYFYRNTLQPKLRALVVRAKKIGCQYNPEADIEANRPFNHPTNYD